ncbi:MAG: YraN family protein [Endomicrobiales bacterium]|nr:YraN family protein [Endomicrobiales bacterium]
MVNLRTLGRSGEKEAVKYLKSHGYKVIENNFHTRYGEIDIIAKENEDLVFVEVKLRRSDKYGSPAEAVHRNKQEKIIKTALQYVKLKNLFDKNLRFDVILIGPDAGKIELVKSAYIAGSGYTY